MYFRVQTDTTANLFNRGFSCLCLWGGAFNRNLYFRVQAGTQTYLGLVFLCLLSGALSLVLYFRVQTGTKTNLFLCLWGGAFSRNLYFRVQAGTKSNLFYRGLVVYVYWEGKVLLVPSCTPEYKQARYKREKNTYQSIDSR